MRGRVGTPQREIHLFYGMSLYNKGTMKSWIKKLEEVYPYERGIKVVQTDNGSEFLGVFDKYLK